MRIIVVEASAAGYRVVENFNLESVRQNRRSLATFRTSCLCVCVCVRYNYAELFEIGRNCVYINTYFNNRSSQTLYFYIRIRAIIVLTRVLIFFTTLRHHVYVYALNHYNIILCVRELRAFSLSSPAVLFFFVPLNLSPPITIYLFGLSEQKHLNAKAMD